MYSQTYLVKTTGSEFQGDKALREALFQCGNYCYSGEIELDFQHAFGEITLRDIPTLVPIVQRQQERLSFLCNSTIPASSKFYEPVQQIEQARDFVLAEIASPAISSKIAKLKDAHRWIDDDESRVYFELVGDTSSLFNDILFIASRLYSEGLVTITIYFEGVIYVSLEDGTGDQPLLDIYFPDISGSGEGATLAIYDDDGKGRNGPWMKLSVWQAKEDQDHNSNHAKVVDEVIVTDLSSDSYVQSYVILKSDGESDTRDVMFQFGSWCYAGQVELVPRLTLSDIPYVIPAVRVQQGKLDFLSDAKSLPASSPFAPAMEYAMQRQPDMEALALGSEAYLRNFVTTLENGEPNEQNWLEDDANESFFEFDCFEDRNTALANVELIATKSYHPNGLISISIYYGGNWYLILDDGEDFPLLDSKFPCIAQRGLGYNIQCYPAGIGGWSQLRKMSIWHIGCDEDDLGEEGDTVSNREQIEGAGTIQERPPVMEKSNRLVEKLDIGNAGDDAETAWGADGKPMHVGAEPTQDKIDYCESDHGEIIADNAVPDKRQHVYSDGGDDKTIVNSGVPNQQHCGDSEDDAGDDGDIYAQLDKLDRKLNRELHGLRELGILQRSSKPPTESPNNGGTSLAKNT